MKDQQEFDSLVERNELFINKTKNKLHYESKENRAMMLYDWILRNIGNNQWEKAIVHVMYHKWRIEWLSIESDSEQEK